MIPAAELAALQTAFAATLDLTCIIQRNSGAKTPGGGKSVTWSNVTQPGGGTVVACGMPDLRGHILTALVERLGEVNETLLSLPIGTNVKADDQIVSISLRGVEVVAGLKFRVEHARDVQSYAVLTQVLIAVIRP